MNARILVLLGGACVVALAIALYVVDGPGQATGQAGGGPLLPGLQERINEVDAIDIVALDGSTVASLRRERDRWRVSEKHDFEADFERIHRFLRNLSRAEREEARTANPDWYQRLGVEAVGEGSGDRAAVRFPGSDLPGVILGSADPAGIGQYVRLEGADRTWLIGQRLDVPVDRLAWLQQAIMDIPAGEMRRVTIRHPDGEVIELRPGDEEGSVWVLLDAPADREVRQAWQLRQRANSLAKLNLVDVRSHDPELIPENVVETTFLTRDGLAFSARLFSDDAGHWVHFRVEDSGDADGNASGAELDDATNGQDGASDAGEAIDIDAVAIDGRLSPWQYAIDQERFERMTSRMKDLLVQPQEAEG